MAGCRFQHFHDYDSPACRLKEAPAKNILSWDFSRVNGVAVHVIDIV
jgi:hypothetical protein